MNLVRDQGSSLRFWLSRWLVMAFTRTGNIKEDQILGGGLFCVFLWGKICKLLNRQMDTQ